ncbi:MAG: hypothetical protein ACRCTQ_06635 [Brevinemataceae bacterium]
MKKICLVLSIIILFSVLCYGQENTPSSKERIPLSLEIGITGYGANIMFGGFDINGNIRFFKKNVSSLWFNTTLMTFIPISMYSSRAPYILFGGLWELQYRVSAKGFLFALETGLGTAGEFIQTEIYSEDKGFHKKFTGITYGLFSAGMRMGYDFEHKYNIPIIFNMFFGYRMQFPFNYTIKHFILYGFGVAYRFDIGGKKNV